MDGRSAVEVRGQSGFRGYDRFIRMTHVAIMQPISSMAGYFALMDSVDQFVLLDSVQFGKTIMATE